MYCCLYSEKTPDDGQRNCLKHVAFSSQNKFEKLVHLIGFIVRRVGCIVKHKESLMGELTEQ